MVEVKEITNKTIWEGWVLQFRWANFLQSWYWGEFHKALSKKIFRRGFYKSGQLEGVMLVIKEPAKRATYLAVPAGPLIDFNDEMLVKAFVNDIRNLAKREGCSFVRVRPQINETKENSKLFSTLGFMRAPFHLHAELTLKLDLGKSNDELMADMRKATRYEIRKAQKMGIQVEASTNPDDMDSFYNLQLQTALRQAFIPFSRDFLKVQFTQFASEGKAILYTAKYNNQVLAQGMMIFYGQEADYHYGASSEAGRNYPGVYMLLWEAIQEAKRRNLKYFDLWGIAPEGDISHRFYGVSLFKRGFGGEITEYLHARDLVVNFSGYAFNWVVEEVRRRTRGL